MSKRLSGPSAVLEQAGGRRVNTGSIGVLRARTKTVASAPTSRARLRDRLRSRRRTQEYEQYSRTTTDDSGAQQVFGRALS